MPNVLGKLLVPPTPKASNSLPELKTNLHTWTRSCEQSIRAIENFLRGGGEQSAGITAPGNTPINNGGGGGGGSHGIPAGGTTGQVLEKVTDLDYDVTWAAPLNGLTTDNLPQGVTNLYFTNAEVYSAFSVTHPLALNHVTGVLSMPQATDFVDGWMGHADFLKFQEKKYTLIMYVGDPVTTGPVDGEYSMPYDTDGVTPIAWTFRRFHLRIGSGVAPAGAYFAVEKSTGVGVFTPTVVYGTYSLLYGYYEYDDFLPLTPFTVNSGDKLRFNIVSIPTPTSNWTVTLEFSNP